jgi:histidinol phosphatase-like PHP family hydrolase
MHSNNSCDCACARISDIISEAKELGIEQFGLSDHIHTPYNLPDIAASRQEYLSCDPEPNFHFGVEVSCVSQWEIDEIAKGNYQENPVYGIRQGGPAGGALAIGINEADIAEYGIEFVVGGTHWPMYVEIEREAVIRDYHRQNMFLACHPLVDIVAHPWWWMVHWADANNRHLAEPWFDDFKAIPESIHDEFAAAVVENDTLVEINLLAMLLNWQYSYRFKRQYLDYLAGLKDKGAKLCIGSDNHEEHYYEIDFLTSASMLERVGIGREDLHCPRFRHGK